MNNLTEENIYLKKQLAELKAELATANRPSRRDIAEKRMLSNAKERIAELEAEKNRNKWYWCAVHIVSRLASAVKPELTTIDDTPEAHELYAVMLIAYLSEKDT